MCLTSKSLSLSEIGDVKEIKRKLNDFFYLETSFLSGIPNELYLKSQLRYFFNLLLNLYLNGNDISRFNKLYYLITFSRHKVVDELIYKIEKLRKIINPNYFAEPSIEEFLISNYKFLKQFENKDSNIKSILHKVITEEYQKKDKTYFKHLISLVDFFKKSKNSFFTSVILSNSTVTMDYVKGYSDLDIMIILSKKVFESIKNIKKCRKEVIKASKQLYLHDPTQHHGFFIFTLSELLFYPEAVYPTVLHEFSSIITGKTNLSYSFTNDLLEKRVFLYRSINKLISFIETDINQFDLFKAKDFISQVTLLPVLYIQYKGVYIYKRDAFQYLEKYFNNTSAFSTAEQLRKEFPFKRVSFWPSFIHPTVLPVYYTKINNTYSLKKITQLKKEVLLLIIEITDKLLNEK